LKPILISFWLLQDFHEAHQGMFSKDCDRKGLKVVLELPRDDEENLHQLLEPLVSFLGVVHEMADIVNQYLDAFILLNQGSTDC